MIKPDLSIIVPNYNNGQYLEECLNSLIHQSHKSIEIVVVDDNSSDNSMEVLNEFIKKDKRLRVLQNKKNMGVGFSKRKGVQYSKAELVGTMGSDDVLTQDAAAKMINAHRKNPEASLVYSTHFICNERLKIININDKVEQIPDDETYLNYSKYTSESVSSFRVFKREYYNKTEGYSSRYKKAVDKDIIFKLEEAGKLVFMNQPLYMYRHHPNNISRNLNSWKAAFWEVRAKEDAYYRRKNTSIPNIDKSQLQAEYYNVLKESALENISLRKYSALIRDFYNFLLKIKNPLSTIKFAIYIFKKVRFPESFITSKY